VNDGRRLWLVRHGETEGQSSIRFHGRNDVRLSEEGRAQIRALAPWLAGVEFERIVHSPLQRAAESAAILAGLCAQPLDRLAADERLREISFGDCEGLTEPEIQAAYPGFLRDYKLGRTDVFPGGERRADFAARVADWTHEFVAQPWHTDVLVVAHRGTLRQVLRALFGLPNGFEDPFGVELASVSIARQAGSWQLDLLGALP
jgi:broad specificity phosphatase PhoE